MINRVKKTAGGLARLCTARALLASVLAVALLAAGAGCDGSGGPAGTEPARTDSQQQGRPPVTADRQGNPITLPEKIERVMVAGPSTAEILVGFGLGGKIAAADTYSESVEGLPEGIPMFDLANPDVEAIVELNPDVMFVTGMVLAEGDDPYKPFKDAGICVIVIPSSNSIDGIKEDIRYIADVMDARDAGETMVVRMEDEIARIKALGDAVKEKKTVYFEISAAPYLYSFGKGVFLNEMIELIGAENILADQQEWLSVSEEAVLNADPDVILTNVNYVKDPVGEISGRAGWQNIKAVADGAVYFIDTDSSSRPSQNITKALAEMWRAVYPDIPA
jgi:iron complex transport system substrate-binding protein